MAANNPFLTLALSRWQTADTAEKDMRVEGEKDLRFQNLEQWESDDKRDREAAGKPTLVIDQIGEPIRQLRGRQRQAKPAIQINPVDNGADPDTAEVFQGLIRHIENTGGAKAARDQAFGGAVGPGWGYYRIITDYEYDDEPGGDPAAQFDQCVKYQAIENQFTVFRDPSTPLHEPWACRWALIVEDIQKEEFKARYPNAKATSAEAFAATGLTIPDWYPEGSVRVADYFYVEEQSQAAVALLEDGTTVAADAVPAGAKVLQTRTPVTRTVYLAKITGAEILEGNADRTAGREWPGKYIPIVPVWGESLMVAGKRTVRGIVRPARDPQRMYNYQNSELVYELALSPKSKVMMPSGAMEGLGKMWEEAPTRAFPALLWNPFDAQGRPMPAPSVAQFTDSTKIQALTVAINQHKADLRSTTGWYDATDPSRRNTDQSGRAILARKESQAEGGVLYMDNLGQSLLFEGKILLDLIPKIYNRPGRVLRVVGLEDETQTESVAIGQPRKGKGARGVSGIFQWGAGRYDVVVSVGASYTTRRQEAAESTLELMKVVPDAMAAAVAPMAVRNMDMPGAKQMADRMERTLPPEIRDEDGEEGGDPRQLKQQMAQMGQQLQEQMQVIQGLQQAIKTKQVEVEAEHQRGRESDAVQLEIARIKAETEALKVRADLIKARAEQDTARGDLLLDAETKRLLKLADLETSARAEMVPDEGMVPPDGMGAPMMDDGGTGGMEAGA